jgi:hypothetical protein
MTGFYGRDWPDVDDPGPEDNPTLDDEYEQQLEHRRKVAEEAAKIRVREDAQALVAAEKTPPGLPFDADLLGAHLARPAEPPMRVQGLIPSDASTLIVAQRKTGKTIMVLNYAKALITGEPLLGQFETRPIAGNVALLNYEVSGNTIARWADEHGIHHSRLFIVNLRGRRNPLSHPDDREKLAKLLRTHDVEALATDPFGRAYTGKSQNDSGEVGQWLVNLDTFARSEVGATDLLLTAHAGWNGERTRGASALEDWADSVITMTRDTDDDSQRFLRAIGRDVDLDEDRLDFHAPTRTLTLAGVGSRKKAAATRKTDGLIVFVARAAHQQPGASTADVIRLIRDMDDAPTFQDRDVSKAALAAQERGFVRIVDNGPGKAKQHYPATVDSGPRKAKQHSPSTPSNPVQTPSTDGHPDPVQPRLMVDGVGVGDSASTQKAENLDGVKAHDLDNDEQDPTTELCHTCGEPLSWQRAAYGKTTCVTCEAAS